MAYTNNFNLEIPNRGDYPGQWDIPINANIISIDSILKNLRDNYSNTISPPNPVSGLVWYDLAGSLLKLYKNDTWKTIIDSDNIYEFLGGTPISNDGILPPVPTGFNYVSYIEYNKQITLWAIDLDWNAVSHDDLDGYIISVQIQGETTRQEFFISYEDSSYKLSGLYGSLTYLIKIRSIDKLKNASAWSNILTIALGADTQAPSAPTSVQATASIRSIIVKFTKSPEADVAGYEVHSSEINGFTPDSTTLKYNGDSTFTSIIANPATTYYIKVRSYDRSGNFSGYSSQTSCVTGKIISSDIADLAIGTQQIADNAISQYKIAQNAITTDKLIDSVITSNKIATNAVISEKLIITDFTNLIPNPIFKTGTNDDWENITVISNTDSEAPVNAPSEFIGRLNILTSLNEAYAPFGASNWIDVTPGETYYVSSFVGSSVSANAQLKIGAIFILEDGITKTKVYAKTFNMNASWVQDGAQIVVPASYYKMKFLAQVQSNASPSGKWYITFSKIRKMSGSTLIEDGAITTNKIATNAITAGSAIIQDGAIANAKLADATITHAKIGTGEIWNANIANLAVDNSKIANLAVDNAKIANLDAVKIVTGFIDAGRINAVNLSVLQAAVSSLSALNADLGNITTGRIAMSGNNSYIRSGKLSFGDNSLAGFWLGNDSDAIPKFKIGNSSSRIEWDGSALKILGSVLIGSVPADQVANKADVTYKVEVISSNGMALRPTQNPNDIITVLTAKVYQGQSDITDTYPPTNFRWTRSSPDTNADTTWNNLHLSGYKTINVTSADLHIRATFTCEVL